MDAKITNNVKLAFILLSICKSKTEVIDFITDVSLDPGITSTEYTIIFTRAIDILRRFYNE